MGTVTIRRLGLGWKVTWNGGDGLSETKFLTRSEDQWKLIKRLTGEDESFLNQLREWARDTEEYENETDFWADDDEHQRMGIDYSPSNPWDAPGMSMSDFI